LPDVAQLALCSLWFPSFLGWYLCFLSLHILPFALLHPVSLGGFVDEDDLFLGQFITLFRSMARDMSEFLLDTGDY
jgi:hypothetical protein